LRGFDIGRIADEKISEATAKWMREKLIQLAVFYDVQLAERWAQLLRDAQYPSRASYVAGLYPQDSCVPPTSGGDGIHSRDVDVGLR